MKAILLSVSIVMFSLTSVQAQTFQSTDWYVFGHGVGCVSMSEIYKLFPYFTGAKTPQEWLDWLRNAPSGTIRDELPHGMTSDSELRPFTEVAKEDAPRGSRVWEDPLFTKTNAVVLVSRKNREGGVVFFRGDLCNALFHPGSK